jgi:threonine aldolase
MSTPQRHFLSDNASGMHPRVLAAIEGANAGHEQAYGHDGFTARAHELLRRHFGADARPFLLLTGSGANVLALRSVLASYDALVVSDSSHIHWDECGGIEAHAGCQVLLAKSTHGKLTPETVLPLLEGEGMVHRARPRALSISQATEWGTIYTADEVRALAALCREHGLLLHMDGARLSGAAATLGLDLGAATTDLGVDVLSFGGTKNGLMAAEAVVFLNDRAGEEFAYVRKQGLQLISKMRFVAAQLIALLEDDLWRTNAAHANRMARLLGEAAGAVPGVSIEAPVEANMVFARLPQAWIEPLQACARFHVWDAKRSIVRWVTSFDTTDDDVGRFAETLSALAKAAG